MTAPMNPAAPETETTYYPQALPSSSELCKGQVRDPATAEAMAYAEKPLQDQIVDEEWAAQALVADMLDEPNLAEQYRLKIQRNLAVAAAKAEKARKQHFNIPL